MSHHHGGLSVLVLAAVAAAVCLHCQEVNGARSGHLGPAAASKASQPVSLPKDVIMDEELLSAYEAEARDAEHSRRRKLRESKLLAAYDNNNEQTTKATVTMARLKKSLESNAEDPFQAISLMPAASTTVTAPSADDLQSMNQALVTKIINETEQRAEDQERAANAEEDQLEAAIKARNVERVKLQKKLNKTAADPDDAVFKQQVKSIHSALTNLKREMAKYEKSRLSPKAQIELAWTDGLQTSIDQIHKTLEQLQEEPEPGSIESMSQSMMKEMYHIDPNEDH